MRRLKTSEIMNDSFGVRIDHDKLSNKDSLRVYRVSFDGKSLYPNDVLITLEQLESMKKDIDEIIEMCKTIKKEEDFLKEM